MWLEISKNSKITPLRNLLIANIELHKKMLFHFFLLFVKNLNISDLIFDFCYRN
jgi:hypothetical protein